MTEAPLDRTICQRVRVMSYNMQGHAALQRREHVRQIAEVIAELEPDVVGLQEVHRRTTRAGSDQFEELVSLTGLEAAFGSSLEAWGGEYGNAVLTRGRVVRSAVHPLPGSGEARSLFECRIELDGLPLEFFVTHLATWGRFLRRTRRQQIEVISSLIRNRATPWVLVGDLNEAPGSPEIRAFLTSDHVRACQFEGATHRFSRQVLDYICSDTRWTTRDARVVKIGPSDHWPIVAELECQREEG